MNTLNEIEQSVSEFEKSTLSGDRFATDLMMKDALIDFNARTRGMVLNKRRALTENSQDYDLMNKLLCVVFNIEHIMYNTNPESLDNNAVIYINNLVRKML